MEENLNPKACGTLTVHDNSHGISKSRPKVRIVHVFAPEIIKTDVANFRELVQRLTGKPNKRSNIKKKAAMAGAPEAAPRLVAVGSQHGYRNPWLEDRIKQELEGLEERERWADESSGGFLVGLEDEDGFLQGIADFPLIPHKDLMGEVHVS